MRGHRVRLGHVELQGFYDKNPEFDVLSFDFHDRKALAALKWTGVDRAATVARLKLHQRLLRVAPTVEAAETLVEAGLTSAHQIASMSRRRFVDEHGQRFGDDGATARQIHASAVSLKAKMTHLWANVRQLVGSSFYRSARFHNVRTDVVDYFEGIPSYQDLFGGLDYLVCPHCRSIYSPCAYFVDLMRVIDEYVTYPNTHKQSGNIPPGMLLEDRRPDLFDLYLTCENTDTVIPFLRVVNGVLEAKIARDLGADPYPKLALAPYPFNLPFQLPLAQIRNQVAALETSLADVYTDYAAPINAGALQGGAAGVVTLAASASSEQGYYVGMQVQPTSGAAAGQRRTIVAYDGSKREALVMPAFSSAPAAGDRYQIDDTIDHAREQLGLSLEQQAYFSTPDPTAAGVSRAYGYDDVTPWLYSWQPGAGKISFAVGSVDVTGDADARFDTNLTVGDRLLCGAEIRAVAKIVSATQLKVDTAWLTSAAATAYQTQKWRAGAGAISFVEKERRVTGDAGTDFTKLLPGDQLQCAQQVRTIAEIRDAHELTVDAAWTAGASNAAYTVNPVLMLERVAVFLARTGLTRDQLLALVNQNMAPLELLNGDALLLFINATGEGLPPLQVVTWYGDPDAPYQWIVGLSLARLDRLSRFARLQKVLGWSYADVDWLLRSSGATEISPAAIETFAAARRLQQTAPSLTPDVIASFWYDLERSGWIYDRDRRDLFDRVYNSPTLLRGLDPYDPLLPPIPFDPDRPLDWKVDERTSGSQDTQIRSRLSGALSISDDDLTTLARFVLSLRGITDGKLPTTLTNLSWLYRLVQQARAFKVQLRDFLTLLRLLWFPSQKLPPAGGIVADRSSTFRAERAAAWALASGFSMNELLYILTGEVSTTYKRPYTDAQLRRLIGDLSTTTQSLRITPVSFVFGDVEGDGSKNIFDAVLAAQFISAAGVVLEKTQTYDTLAFTIAVTALSFVTPSIDAAQAAEAYTLLVDKKILIVGPDPLIASVSATFDSATSLSFLFPGDPQAAMKQAQVQVILLQLQADVRNNVQVLNDARLGQEDAAEQGVAGFIALPAEALPALLAFTLETATLGVWRAALLTPLATTDPVPPSVEALIATLSRAALWVARFRYSAVDLAGAALTPSAFGIADTTELAFDDLGSLHAFKTLAARFNDQDEELLAYFVAPAVERVARLAVLSGWPAEQITRLSSAFWPEAAGTGDQVATVAGVDRLGRAFDLADETGVDVFFLLDLTSLIHLSIGRVGGAPIDAAWKLYVQQSGRTLDAVAARYGEVDFAPINEDLTGQIDTQKRDALLGYTIWSLHRDFPFITGPEELFQFLLLDVQMSSCAQTSKMAQAISSVQLYLQRARMSLEPGVTRLDIDPIWWDWLSGYRLWEANRKIFVHPENFLLPGTRSGETPQFAEVARNLQQTDVSDAAVTDGMLKYCQELAGLANMTITGTYNARVHFSSGDRDVMTMFARAGTDPFTYYFRTYDQLESWSPWLKIDLSIDARIVVPVYAFSRLFGFWVENTTTKTATIVNAKSEDRFFTDAKLMYSILGLNMQWMQPQTLIERLPIDIGKNDYRPANDKAIKPLFDTATMCWGAPYPLGIARGIPGSGRVDITNSLGNVSGIGTLFRQEVRVGDELYCGGETRPVIKIFSDQELLVEPSWTISPTNAEYKVIPGDPQTSSFPPFTGTGKVDITKNLDNVSGSGTKFKLQVSIGDRLLVGAELRTVVYIRNDTDLLVHKPWNEEYVGAAYTVVPKAIGAEQLVVLYGAPLDTQLVITIDTPPVPDNPGRDTFVEQLEAFNFSLFYALKLAENARLKLKVTGDVTVSLDSQLDSDLNLAATRSLLADYGFSASDAPRPFAPLLDRREQMLRVTQSDDAVFDNYWGNSEPGTGNFPRAPGQEFDLLYNISAGNARLVNVGNQVGWFTFDNGDESFLVRAAHPGLGKLAEMTYARRIVIEETDRQGLMISAGAYTKTPVDMGTLKFDFLRTSTATVARLRQKLLAGGIENLLTISSQETPELRFNRFYALPSQVPPHVNPPHTDLLDFDGAYGIYFQEIFLFIPWMVANRLRIDQRFADAKRWFQYIFNPTAMPELGDEHESDRFWRYLPFRDMDLQRLAEVLQDPRQITQYNDHPFDPDAIARLRPGAYAKAVVIGYIKNLLEWGDFQFAIDTRESIDEATQLYVLAGELLGTRPQAVGECKLQKPINFREIRARYGQDIPQFVIDLENSHSSLAAEPPVAYRDVPFNDIQSYFCVPENAEMIGLWDWLEDRLYKIRHCMNLQGVVRQLALFAPPLNPHDLVRGGAAGRGQIPTGTPPIAAIPHYRFSTMIARARSFTDTVSAYGGAILAALEKRDGEQLALLRNSQEKALLELTTLIKEQAIQEVANTSQALQQSLLSAEYRLKHYGDLIEARWSDAENQHQNSVIASIVMNSLAAISNIASSIAFMVPQVGAPTAMTFGGRQVGAALQAAGGVFQSSSAIAHDAATLWITKAGFDRRAQDWELQKAIAGFDVAQINAQILANDARMKMAERDLELNKTQIAQNQAIDKFLTGKFTNVQLYDWIVARLSDVYFQAYLMALDLARSAQRAFQFERGTNQRFVNFSYWDSLRKGLLAGETLTFSLAQMDKAYTDADARPFEITRTISLLNLDPKALLDLKSTGQATFSLPESLFDFDYPGHYRRMIKTLAVSIPVVVGPYQNVKATLTQLSNQVVLTPNLKAVDFLLGGTRDVPTPDVLRTGWWPNQQIAISTGVHDSGLFQPDLADPRYLPFEGTGAVSTWRLSMPLATNRVPFSGIADVILELKYTAFDGGKLFRDEVTQLPGLAEYAGSPLLNFNQQYSQEWFAFLHDHSDPATQTLRFRVDSAIVPPHVHDAQLTGFFFLLQENTGAGAQAPMLEAAPYITFAVSATESASFALSPSDTWSQAFKDPVPMADVFGGERTITFDLAKTPAKFKKDGYLNPEAVKNIGVILFYEGTVKWK